MKKIITEDGKIILEISSRYYQCSHNYTSCEHAANEDNLVFCLLGSMEFCPIDDYEEEEGEEE